MREWKEPLHCNEVVPWGSDVTVCRDRFLRAPVTQTRHVQWTVCAQFTGFPLLLVWICSLQCSRTVHPWVMIARSVHCLLITRWVGPVDIRPSTDQLCLPQSLTVAWKRFLAMFDIIYSLLRVVEGAFYSWSNKNIEHLNYIYDFKIFLKNYWSRKKRWQYIKLSSFLQLPWVVVN